jgi:PAS domain S-box-containing protein
LAWFVSSRIAKSADLFHVATTEMSRSRVPVIGKPGVTEFDQVINHVQAAATSLRQHSIELRRLNERFRAAEEGSNALVYDVDLRSGYVWCGDTLSQLLGYNHDEIGHSAEAWGHILHPDEGVSGVVPVHEDGLDESGRYTHEYRIRHKNGHYVWLWDRGRAIRSPDGTPLRRVGTLIDITERKEMERIHHLLLRELSHRVKNSLTVIQSIASQTLQSSPEPAAFAETFMGRVQSLARAHDLLTAADWRGVTLRALIASQLGAIGLERCYEPRRRSP